MDPRQKRAIKRGEWSESQAHAGLSRLPRFYPHRYRNYRQSSPDEDARGVDAFIDVNVSKNKQPHWMTVPIEIKSSTWGIAKWKMTHPQHYKAGVVHFYIRRDYDLTELMTLFIKALDSVRHNSKDGSLYKPWFKDVLYRGRMSRGGRKVIRKIIEKRLAQEQETLKDAKGQRRKTRRRR